MTQKDLVDELWARQQIHDTLMRFSRGVDRADADLIRSCFHEESYDDHGDYKGDGWGLADYIVPLSQSMLTHHALANILIELEGDRAFVETYFFVTHRLEMDGEKKDLWVNGRYIDRHELRGGEWKIAERRVVLDWSRMAPVDEDFWMMDQYTSGTSDKSDLVYTFRQAART